MAGKSKAYELAIKIAGKVDSSLRKACGDADESFTELANSAKAAGEIAAKAFTAAATAAASVATASVTAYTAHQKAANNIAASTGAVGDELEHLQSAMETVYRDNFGEDIQDVADAVSVVNRNLKDLPEDQIVGATEAALALRDAFEYQTEETTRAAAAIEKNFGGSALDAFSLIAAGAQSGLDYSGELLDTISEYSSQFSKLGFSADGMFGLLQSGADSTAWNLDKVGDAIKEFSIRSIDGSNTTIEAFEDLGYNAETMMATFATGGETANDAFFDVLNTLMDVDDSVQRDAIGVALFGTMWEDLGTEAMEAMANASTAAYDTQHALEQVTSVQYGDLGTQWQGILRQVEGYLVLIGEQLTPYLQEGMEYLSTTLLPEIAAGLEEILPQIMETAEWIWENREAISQIVIALTAAVTTFIALQKAATVLTAIKSMSAIFMAGAKSGGVLSTVVKLLGGKFTIIAGIIAAVVAAGVLLYKNWDTVIAWAKKMGTEVTKAWSNIKTQVSKAVSNLVASFKSNFPILSSYVTSWWENIQDTTESVKKIFKEVISFITNVFKGNWKDAWQDIVDVFGEVFGSIVNIAKVPINGVIGAINWVIQKINGLSFTVPNEEFYGEWAGKTIGFNLPEIPELAEGGVATAATLAMIGEGGEPEAILPLSKLGALLSQWTNTLLAKWSGVPKPDGSAVLANLFVEVEGGESKTDTPLAKLADLLDELTRTPKPEGGTGTGAISDGDQIIFSPVFNFYGTTSREDMEQATRASFEEFKRMYKRLKKEENRKQFSPA